MDFSLSPELAELRVAVRDFMEKHVIPVEKQVLDEDRQRTGGLLVSLQQKAREAGLWTPHLPPEYGGRGLGIMGMCVLFREMGRSPVGARVFNCDAPDQGNMDLLLKAASAPLRDKYLKPLCAGEITSAFCMTEPAPGAGADPSNMLTRATPDGDGWVINGHKWYSTGGNDASFLIVMARTPDDKAGEKSGGDKAAGDKAVGDKPDAGGASMFVVDRHAPGVEHLRDIGTMAEGFLAHREAEFKFKDVRVGPEAVLAKIGDGFRLAQVRLVPARLTHCMRWLGLADRALELSRGYLLRRKSFGKLLADHQFIQKMLAENAAGVHAGNLMTFHCAWMLEQGRGREARAYSSIAKTQVARLLCKVLDDAIQMHGGLGYSEDMPFGLWYRHARAARIADGPDEVHEMVIAREFLKGDLRLLV